jgi:hypothetical protein
MVTLRPVVYIPAAGEAEGLNGAVEAAKIVAEQSPNSKESDTDFPGCAQSNSVAQLRITRNTK